MKRIVYGWVNAVRYIQSEVSGSHTPHNPQRAGFLFLPL